MDKSKLKIYSALVWLVLTSSLILWWMYFALDLVAQLGEDSHRHQNMLILEGFTLLILLLVGGGTLIYLISKEAKRANIMRDFFAAFSHDMKTAIASLRLQTESLQQDLRSESELQPVLGRLVADTSRILVATDNSLHIAKSGQHKFLSEAILLEELISRMKASWPQLSILVNGDSRVLADQRALHNIFENIFYNSIAHGEATEIKINISENQSMVQIEAQDNGLGFDGDISILGEAFHRHSVSSGSGLGLSIVKSLIQQLGGNGPNYKSEDNGFSVYFEIPKGAE